MNENKYNSERTYFNLLGSYNPNDLMSNAKEFERLLNEWKELYDVFGIEVEKYDSIDELYDNYEYKRN